MNINSQGSFKRHCKINPIQSFGVKECDDELKKIFEAHTKEKTGVWIKDPNITKKNDKRIVEKPDTTKAKGYTINEDEWDGKAVRLVTSWNTKVSDIERFLNIIK